MDGPQAIAHAKAWFGSKGWEMFPFQEDCFRAVWEGRDGMLTAPTGTGKTLALAMPALIAGLNKNGKGLKLLWITPLRALSVDICHAIQHAADELGLDWSVERRSGDVSSAVKRQQLSHPPEVLVTTPESVQLLLATKGYARYFKQLQLVVMDEWHELMGNKRGVQCQLAWSRLAQIAPACRLWGISATVGNMDQAVEVLMGTPERMERAAVVHAAIQKKLGYHTLLPEKIDEYPWAGHLGIRMLPMTLPIIRENRSTLLFTNTRSQAEIWYQRLIEDCPELIGEIAMHHGSLDKDMRDWVEQALHEGRLRAVVCTSSLDLGVDFRPVSAVIQIGSPKGIARLIQRAGRSGHSPFEESKLYFLPTHSIELVESMAIQRAIEQGFVEERQPVQRSFDVLIQYMVTLAVSDGFDAGKLLQEVRQTHAYQSLSDEEWGRLCAFVTRGGDSLQAYEEFNKVQVVDGLFKVTDRRVARHHRLSMGTIVSDTAMTIAYQNGKKIGTVEEYFVSRLRPGDSFAFAGLKLELVKIEGFRALVRPSTAKRIVVPSWQGGRMSLSSEVSEMLRKEIDGLRGFRTDPVGQKLRPLLQIQERTSHIPALGELLIERYRDEEGVHIFIYPFEGRMCHEGLAMLLAYRISQMMEITITTAMNDYGFELLSDSEIPLMEALEEDWFRTEGLLSDISASSNMSEMARRKFRNIASISGLTFKGYPGKEKRARHLQAHSSLFFEVFSDYDKENLLLQQAYEEVLFNELDAERIRRALERIATQHIVIRELEQISPLAFPILVDRLSTGALSSESLSQRVAKMLER